MVMRSAEPPALHVVHLSDVILGLLRQARGPLSQSPHAQGETTAAVEIAAVGELDGQLIGDVDGTQRRPVVLDESGCSDLPGHITHTRHGSLLRVAAPCGPQLYKAAYGAAGSLGP